MFFYCLRENVFLLCRLHLQFFVNHYVSSEFSLNHPAVARSSFLPNFSFSLVLYWLTLSSSHGFFDVISLLFLWLVCLLFGSTFDLFFHMTTKPLPFLFCYFLPSICADFIRLIFSFLIKLNCLLWCGGGGYMAANQRSYYPTFSWNFFSASNVMCWWLRENFSFSFILDFLPLL